jgi:hypothetical protein
MDGQYWRPAGVCAPSASGSPRAGSPQSPGAAPGRERVTISSPFPSHFHSSLHSFLKLRKPADSPPCSYNIPDLVNIYGAGARPVDPVCTAGHLQLRRVRFPGFQGLDAVEGVSPNKAVGRRHHYHRVTAGGLEESGEGETRGRREGATAGDGSKYH